jgi:hypothetical protein
MSKEAYSILATLVAFSAFWPYISSVLSNKTKPHFFSWVIWGTTTFIVFLAQLQANAGVGAWPTGISALLNYVVAILAYGRKSDFKIAKSDWIFLGCALASIPFWVLTSDPLWAVVILTCVDICGFGPTLRKAYVYPREEKLMFFGLFILQNGLVLLALEEYSTATVLFPSAIGLACLILVVTVLARRKVA